MYSFNHEEVVGMFTSFSYTIDIVYPYAIAKLLGVLALWFLGNKGIKEYVDAAFFFAFILAFFAQVMLGYGEQMGAALAMMLLSTSYIIINKKITNG